MLKVGYVVAEKACLAPGSGACQHIRVGMEQLGKQFAVTLLTPEGEMAEGEGARQTSEPTKSREADSSLVRGFLRDVVCLLRRSRQALRTCLAVRKQGFDFVYYRACFLDPFPFFCRVAGIPCFIEANGLQFESRRKYYRSPLESWNRWFERLSYRVASHVFFVGSYGDYWNLPGDNWSNVENGVESEFLDHFKEVKSPTDGPVRLAFVGSLMRHHRPDVLVDAVKQFAAQHEAEIHLIGSKLEPVEAALRDEVPVVSHGFLKRSALAEVLAGMDVGLISGAPEYQSQMKLFDYGAARLAVVAPDTAHLKAWHGDVLAFFPKGDAAAMAERLEELVTDPQSRVRLGSALHDRIRERFTWERVFDAKVRIIRAELEAMGDSRVGTELS